MKRKIVPWKFVGSEITNLSSLLGKPGLPANRFGEIDGDRRNWIRGVAEESRHRAEPNA
jgi:hypothetical protein